MAVLSENERYPEATETNLPPSVSTCLEAVERMLITSTGMDQNALQNCQAALAELQKIYHNLAYTLATADANVELGDVSPWQLLVPMNHIRLVQPRDPPALIILAHYVATMTVVHTAWYTQNWAEYALRGVGQALDAALASLADGASTRPAKSPTSPIRQLISDHLSSLTEFWRV